MHDIKVMAENIGLLITKLTKNTLFYPFIGQSKIKILLLTGLKIKYNVIIL